MSRAPHLVGMLDSELNAVLEQNWKSAFNETKERHRMAANLLAPAVPVLPSTKKRVIR